MDRRWVMDSQSKISRRGFLGAVAALGTVSLAGCAVEPYAASYRSAADRPAGQLPVRGEFVVRNAYVLTMDPALGDLERGDIHVRDGEIVAVGANLVALGAETIDGRILKRGGQLVALDTERVVREAAETLTRVRARAGAP